MNTRSKDGTGDDTLAAVAALRRELQLMRIYAARLTGMLALVLVCAAAPPPKKPKFEEIDVERGNVVEADGKVRMVISNKARSPRIP